MLLRAHASRRLSAARLGMPAALAACAAVAVGAPAMAGAAVRYASPTSTAASGACAQAAPCTLAWAVSGASAGDDVTLAPGDYSLSKQLRPSVAINLHGTDGQAAPRLLADAATNGPYAVGLPAGGSIRHVAISAAADHQAALALNGATGDDLVLSTTGAGDTSSGQQAVVLLGIPNSAAPDTVLRDSVAWAKGPSMGAVVVQHSLSGFDSTVSSSTSAAAGADLVNVTAIATGAGAAAVRVVHDTAAVTLGDVIARGAALDLVSANTTTSVSYSDFRPAVSSGFSDAGHNIAADPLFANAGTGDFHELSESPTIDAGVLTPQSGAVDPDANPRTIGAAPDIGAYEFNPTAPSLAGGSLSGHGGAGGAPTTGASAAPGSLPPPVAHQNFDVETAKGTVLVRRPGAAGFSVLSAGQQMPLGSIVDASRGVVALTSARDALGTTQTGSFWGGQFRVTQTPGAQPQTRLSLTGDLSGCHRPTAAIGSHVGIAAAVRRRPSTRLVWGSDNHGHFSTRGANALATVRGTMWMTEDRCDGTLTRVVKGQVTVRNLRTGHSFTIRAGHKRLVRGHR
jgi:hypothetical protein